MTFEHGGDITSFAKLCRCNYNEVIDLSSNINFVKPHIDVDFNALNIAPYPHYETLYKDIASHYSVCIDEMELFNGGSSAIFSLFAYVANKKEDTSLHVTIYSPAYLEYKKAVQRFGYESEYIDRFENFDADIRPNSLVIFVNPSTPDGMFYDIQALLNKWEEKQCTVLIDESFIEFTSKTSVTKYLKHYPNLYILKSMTKFFGAAGIRMGTLISQKHNIATLKYKQPLWKLSTFDATYIQAVLKDKMFKNTSDKANSEAKTYLLHTLQNSKYVETIYPSYANYVLVRLNITVQLFQEKLIPYKVMVRACENFDGLDAYHVRIAVKSMDDLTIFKKALYA